MSSRPRRSKISAPAEAGMAGGAAASLTSSHVTGRAGRRSSGESGRGPLNRISCGCGQTRRGTGAGLLVEVYPEKVTAVLLRSVGAALTITVYDSVGDGDRGGFERPHPGARWAPVGAPYDLQVEKKRSPVVLLRASVSVPESAGAAYSVVVLAGEVDATNSDELYGVLEDRKSTRLN